MSLPTLAAAGAIVAALALAGYQAKQAADSRTATATVKAEFATYKATQEKQAREALAAEIVKRNKADQLRQRAQDDEYIARVAAQADAATLRASGGQLRRYAADLAAALGSCSAGAASTAGSAPANAAGNLLADLSGRIDEAAESIAIYADEARRAGNFCVATYEALTP